MADWKNVHLADQDVEITALRARVETLQAVHEAELGVCEEHCEVVEGLKARVEKLENGRPIPSGKIREHMRLIPSLCAPLDMPTRLELAINDICLYITPMLDRIEVLEAQRDATQATVVNLEGELQRIRQAMGGYKP